MAWESLLDLGIAGAITLGAKRELNKFRDVFQGALDRLTESVEKLTAAQADHEARLASLENEDTPVYVLVTDDYDDEPKN